MITERFGAIADWCATEAFHATASNPERSDALYEVCEMIRAALAKDAA